MMTAITQTSPPQFWFMREGRRLDRLRARQPTLTHGGNITHVKTINTEIDQCIDRMAALSDEIVKRWRL